MIARSAGGRRAATWSALKPPQELPIIPTAPGAPRLGREPGDDLHGVVLLEREVLVGEHAVRVPAAALVDAHAGVAVPGDVGVRERVPLRREVAPAVGDVLEDRRHGVLVGVDRQPHPRGEPGAVREGDPDRVETVDRPRERGHGGHGAALYRLVATWAAGVWSGTTRRRRDSLPGSPSGPGGRDRERRHGHPVRRRPPRAGRPRQHRARAAGHAGDAGGVSVAHGPRPADCPSSSSGFAGNVLRGDLGTDIWSPERGEPGVAGSSRHTGPSPPSGSAGPSLSASRWAAWLAVRRGSWIDRVTAVSCR